MSLPVRSLAMALRLLVTTIALFGMASAAHATLSFDLRTGDNSTRTQKLTVDSNKCPSQGPTAAFVGGMVTNTSGSTITSASVTLTGLNASIFLAGGQSTTQYIGSLAAGESIAIYWFTGFTCTENAIATPVVTMTSSAGIQSAPLTLIVKHAISANAGGQVIGSQLGPGAVVGQTIYFDADYDFGGTVAGDEYFLQPSGGQNFDAACFRLVGSEIIGSNVNAAPVGTTNRLYVVQPNKQSGNGYFISVRYYFEYLCAGQSTTARPYAVQTSGTQIKYTGNFDGTGSVSISFPGATNPFTIEKSVSETVGVLGTSGNLTYTVTISNPSAHDSILGEIVDTLPTGMAFVALTADSDVTLANSSATPSAGATGTVRFVGRRGQSYALAGGGSVTLKYTVTRPTTIGVYTNSAQGVFGAATTPVAQATYSHVAPQPLSVTKVSAVISDPFNGSAEPKAIPGALIEYVITVSNPSIVPADLDSLVIVDDTPLKTKMCQLDVSSPGPLTFLDGTVASGLTYVFTALSNGSDDVEFSNDDGATWTYTPTPDADGCDSAITNFRVRPSGVFLAGGSFTLRTRFIIE